MVRRSISALLALGLGALVIAGCGGSQASSSSAPPSSAAATPGAVGVSLTSTTPAATGQVRQVTWDLPTGEPPTIDPVKSGDYSSQMVVSNLCDSLFRDTPTWGEVPSLAQSYSYPNPRTLVLNIRQGVRFWNGQPLTASDVVYSLERNENPKTGSINEATFQGVTGIDQTGPYQVTVHLATPDENFVRELADEIGAVVEKSYVEKVGNQKFGTAQGGVMCSGPYELKSWVPGQQIVLVRNPHYWDTALEPKIAQVTLEFVTDSSDLTTALESGQFQGAYEAPISDIPALRRADTGQLHFGPSLQTFVLWPANPTGPGADPTIRKALSMVIDRSAIVQKILYGAGSPNVAAEPPATWTPPSARSIYQAAYEQLPGTTPDPAAARTLLKTVKDPGKPIVIGLTAGDQVEVNLASAIQSEAAEVGLNVQLKELTPLGFSNALYVPSARKGLDFLLSEDYLLIPDQLDELSYFVYPGALLNYANYNNKTVAQLITEARATYSGSARAQLLVKAQAIYMKDEMVVPIVSLPEVSFVSNKLSGETTSFAYLFEPSLAYIGAK